MEKCTNLLEWSEGIFAATAGPYLVYHKYEPHVQIARWGCYSDSAGSFGSIFGYPTRKEAQDACQRHYDSAVSGRADGSVNPRADVPR